VSRVVVRLQRAALDVLTTLVVVALERRLRRPARPAK
jgi:hypothetical protein